MTSSISTDAASPGAKVLFVHPAGPDRDLYVSALNGVGFQTTAESDVAAAAAMFETGHSFDVIVTELLPEAIDTWRFVERRCAEIPHVPIVIVTSLIRPDHVHRRMARVLGCAAFVAKPCSVMQLVDVVTRVSEGARGLEVSVYVEPGAPP